jgi:hypothetical protein
MGIAALHPSYETEKPAVIQNEPKILEVNARKFSSSAPAAISVAMS